MTKTLTCDECGDERPVTELIVRGGLDDPNRVVCPEDSTVDDRIV